MKKLILLLIVGILLSTGVSGILEWHSYYPEDEVIVIREAWGSRIVDLQLIKNTDKCFIDCYAIIRIQPYKSITINENYGWIFEQELATHSGYVMGEPDGLLSWGLKKREIITKDILVNDYKDCEYERLSSDNITYETYTEKCIIGNHTETISEEIWKEWNWNNEVLKKDEVYYIKLEGKKYPKTKIEWIPKFYGFELKEWAWWDSFYEHKRRINATFGSDLTTFPFLVNGSSGIGLNSSVAYLYWAVGNITSDSYFYVYYNNETQFAFTNSSETVEFAIERDLDRIGKNATKVFSTNTYTGVYHLSGSADLNDSTDWNKDLTVGATPPPSIEGVFGNALNFSTGEFHCPFREDDGLSAGTNNLSLQAWVKINDSSFQGTIASLNNGGSCGNDGCFQISVIDGKIRGHMRFDVTILAFGTTVISDWEWHHVALTLNRRGNMVVYVDGKEEATFDVSNKSARNIVLNRLSFGGEYSADCDGSAASSIYSGGIDDAIYSNTTAFTASWINATYQQKFNTFSQASSEKVLNLPPEFEIKAESFETTTFETKNTTFSVDIEFNKSAIKEITSRLILNQTSHNATNVVEISIVSNISLTRYNRHLSPDLIGSEPSVRHFFWNITIEFYNGTIINATTLGRDQNINFSYFIYNITADKKDVLETSQTVITVNVTKKESQASIQEVFIEYKQTNTTANRDENETLWETHNATVTVPLTNGSASENVVIFGYLNISFEGSTIVRKSAVSFTQTVNQISLDDCSSFTEETINFTFKDEDSQNSISQNFEATFTVSETGTGNERNVTFDKMNTTEVNICLSPPWATFVGDAVIRYEGVNETYISKNYYLNNFTFSNASQNIDLYGLRDERSTSFVVFIMDAGRTVKPNVFIKSQRFYITNNSFRIVEMGRTDSEGKAVLHFVVEEPEYIFVIEENLVTIHTTTPSKMVCLEAPCTKEIQIATTQDPFAKVNFSNAAFTMRYDNQSKVIFFTFSDPSGATEQGRLEVTKRSPAREDENVCDTSLVSSSGTLICNLSGLNGYFVSQGFLSQSAERQAAFISVDQFNITSILYGNKDASFLAFFVIIMIGLIGFWSITVSGVFMLLALAAMSLGGFIQFSSSVILGLAVMLVIILIQAGRRGV